MVNLYIAAMRITRRRAWRKGSNAAFKKVNSSNRASGIDGQSWKGFALNQAEEIAELLFELRTNNLSVDPC